MNRTTHVRLGLVAVASLFALLVVIGSGHSQPPGGFRPPGAGTAPGFGIGGGPAMPNFPHPPAPHFPQPPAPTIPPPPAAGGGINIYSWRCGRCGRVLGSGPVPPATAYCPFCGATNTFNGAGGVAQTPANPPAFAPAGPAAADPPQADPDDSLVPRGPGFRMSIISIAVALLIIVGVVTVVAVLVKEYRSQPRPARRRRRRRRFDDDY